jgi:hypothetical protein
MVGFYLDRISAGAAMVSTGSHLERCNCWTRTVPIEVFSLGSIVEGFSEWRREGAIPRGMGPGESNWGEASVGVLAPALVTLAAEILVGVTGNAVYDLIKTVAR